MKKLISNFLVAATGGVVAIAGVYLLSERQSKNSNQILNRNEQNPIRFANYNSTAAGTSFADFTLASEKSLQAVVHIKTISEQVNNLAFNPFAQLLFGHQPQQQTFIQQGSGSGVIISQDGYIVTNNHVIAGSNKIEVVLNDKRSFEAEIIGTDASTDVALIRIKEKNLPFLNYGNSDLLKIGEWVLAVGNPFNLNSTVTAGIISAKGRNNILNGNNKPIESFIQTDAAVNPGNSGGALVNTDGELIGINTAIASNNGAFQGYSFAVPVNIVRKVISDLVEFGTVQRAYIGISIQDINAKFAEEKKLKQLNGVYVNGVTEGGSAEESGMNEGDIITKIQDVPVTSVSELQEQLSKYRPGDKISVTIDRKDSEKNLALVLKSADNTTRLIKKSENASSPVASLGATFSEVDNNQLAAIGLQNGVKVSKIVAGKISLMGIQEGFIITSINRKKMVSVSDVKSELENKHGVVLIEGFYPNGMRASYSFAL